MKKISTSSKIIKSKKTDTRANTENDEKILEKGISKAVEKKKNTPAKDIPKKKKESKKIIESPSLIKSESEIAPQKIKQTSTKKDKNPRRIRIILELEFHTLPGQSIWVTSTGLLLGDSVLKQMNYFDNDHWRLELFIEPELLKEDLHYRYHIKQLDGSFLNDYQNKILVLKTLKTDYLLIRDFWGYAGYHENVYYKAPFDYLIQREASTKLKEVTATSTHLFQIKVAYLQPTEGVAILGNVASLGAWNTSQFQPLHYDAKLRIWKSAFTIKSLNADIEYKYAIYNKETNEIVRIENGENRQTYTLPYKGLVLQNDGFIHLEDIHWRGAGLNIPLFSIRTEKDLGVGDFGSIKTIVDWMSSVGLKLLQLLPINDTTVYKTWKDSYPYSAISVFAIHPIYLDIPSLLKPEWEKEERIAAILDELKLSNEQPQLDYEVVLKHKWELIEYIYKKTKKDVIVSSNYKNFVKENEYWLKAYASFCVLRDLNESANYDQWEGRTSYSEDIFKLLYKSDKDKIQLHYFVQFQLSQQLKDSVQYAHQHNITLKGDIPIGVNRYSVDVWQHPDLFNTEMQAGAPPDFFAKDGQNWGFPTYQWETMEKDDYAWWKSRLSNMAKYFDAIRIDHILGFFRIWSIPEDQLQGILGYFQPSIPIDETEFADWNIPFNYERYCLPCITEDILQDTFGDKVDYVKAEFLEIKENGFYAFKEEYNTQKKIKDLFDHFEYNVHNDWLLRSLMGLIANVIFIPDTKLTGKYHCRFALYETSSYSHLSDWEKKQLYYLYLNYFFERQDYNWSKIGYKQLSAVTSATDMMICGEDLGMVPKSVPQVMNQLGILGLKVQRMSDNPTHLFSNPLETGFLNVVTPSTHDMPPIRNWWNQADAGTKESFYKTQIHFKGSPPELCNSSIVSQVVFNHLQSPALWCLFLMQDLLSMEDDSTNPDLNLDIINRPEIPNFYWRYRMPFSVEKLRNFDHLNGKIKNLLQFSNR